jgi:hypothetical protein
MRVAQRWALAGVATALAVLTPYAGRLHRVDDPDVATASLTDLVRDSAATGYSGTVTVQGRVGLPIADHFSDLADLFGGQTRLAVWWRSDQDWRVDRLTDTGEVDLFHRGRRTTEWSYERSEARTSTDPEIRLPRDSDLLPPEIARRALDGQPTSSVSRLPARRVAGVDAAGLRVAITDLRSTIRHVDLWVDPATGVTIEARVYGDSTQPAVTTAFTRYSRSQPTADLTRFRPASGVPDYPDRAIDIADAADQFAPVRTPSSVAGLARSSGRSAAVYGHGLTRVLVIPLPYRDAQVLASQLEHSGGRTLHGQRLLRVGPLGVMLTRASGPLGIRWLVGGTVTDATLLDAAHDLATGARARRGSR